MSKSRRKQAQIEANDSVSDEMSGPEQPPADRVAARAYELYEQRGGEHGRDWDDWFTAERELQERE